MPTKKLKVVAFNGSPRPDGNTGLLIRRVFQELEREGIGTELVDMAGSRLRGCTACMRCRTEKNRRCVLDDDPLNSWLEKMFDADGILLGSPTYFADITSELKALIDRAGFVGRGNGNLFRRKVGAAVIAARRAGAIHAFDSINHFFLANEMIIPGSSYWNLAIGREKGEVEQDQEGMTTMTALGQNMAWLMKRMKP